MDESLTVLTDAFVGVTDGKFVHVGTTPPPESDLPAKIIDGTGMVMLPGLVNCHTQLGASLLRGCGGMPQAELFALEERLDARAVKAAALLSIAECVRFGVTSVSDLYYYAQSAAEAASESGIKANVAGITALFSGEEFDARTQPACIELRELRGKWHGHDGGRIRAEASVAEFSSTHPLWESVARYAAEEGLGMHVPLSETAAQQEGALERSGLTPAQVLDCHGVFGGRTCVAHGTHLTDEDMALLGRRRATAVLCPTSDLRRGAGRADAAAMVKSGMNAALGTDSAVLCGDLDLFREMRLTALCCGMPAPAVLMMATVCGARAQGREKECGMIKTGMDADLCLLDFTQPHLIPCRDLMEHVVHSASGRDVVLTMVRGRTLYAAGTYPTIDLSAVMEELKTYAIPRVFGGDREEADS